MIGWVAWDLLKGLMLTFHVGAACRLSVVQEGTAYPCV